MRRFALIASLLVCLTTPTSSLHTEVWNGLLRGPGEWDDRFYRLRVGGMRLSLLGAAIEGASKFEQCNKMKAVAALFQEIGKVIAAFEGDAQLMREALVHDNVAVQIYRAEFNRLAELEMRIYDGADLTVNASKLWCVRQKAGKLDSVGW